MGGREANALINLLVQPMPSHIQHLNRAGNHSINLLFQDQFAFIRVH